MRYPLGQYEAESITSKTGKKLSDITLDQVRKGNITADDIKISKDMLKNRDRFPRKQEMILWR